MGLSSAQKIGVGALMGGVASVGTSMLLRYLADNKGTAAADGTVEFPILWEHAPLFGILGGALATGLSYYLWGTEAAVAAGMTALVAGVAPPADDWVKEARAEADLEEQKTPADGEPGGIRGMRGSDVVDLKARVARLESVLEDRIAA